MSQDRVIAALLWVILAGTAAVQGQTQAMPGMDMSTDMSSQGMSTMNSTAVEGAYGAADSMHSMEHHHMDMGPHMKMTTLRDAKPGDDARVAEIAEKARQVADKYTDYRTALADGYKIFLPNVPQKQYHFTNNRYAVEAALRFNPEHPASLLYEKHGDNYQLIGVMYTAPKRMSESDLDKRIPLSVAQWHQHVNFCAPPADQKQEMLGPNNKFGLFGSITTKQECEQAGGKFFPVIFGWMVHVYPFEKSPQEIWAVEHGHGRSAGQ